MKQETARVPQRGTAKLSVSSLPFAETPGQSRLFLEYLRDPVSLRRFYPNAVTSPSDVSALIPQVLENHEVDRPALSAALLRTNTELAGGEKSLANARLLADDDCVAVVTGQQAGLFTGPLYTIYKALSAIRMAEQLTASRFKAVPVFWMATEDHDFDEVSETYFAASNGELIRSQYRPAGYVANSPVGRVPVDEAIAGVVDDIFKHLPQTAFSSQMRALMASSWIEGTTFGDAFGKTILALLGRFGIVVIDPLYPEIKKLAQPMYARAATHVEDVVKNVRERSRELEAAGYHAQVVVEEDHLPLFWHDDAGQRLALRKAGERVYRAKSRNNDIELDELHRTAETEPERLSPGVMLRPVVQDYLLPTVCYFGGAAEIAYFAQNSVVYETLGRPVTPIFHRQSFTVLEPKQRRNLDKLQLTIPILFAGKERLLLQIAAQGPASDVGELFGDVEKGIAVELDRLDKRLSQTDPTLNANLATRRRKIVYHIRALLKKTLTAESRKDEVTMRRVDHLLATLLPNGHLQERSLNVFTFLNTYGPNFIDRIYDAVDLNDNDHRIIDI